jgi:hypothetical protein
MVPEIQNVMSKIELQFPFLFDEPSAHFWNGTFYCGSYSDWKKYWARHYDVKNKTEKTYKALLDNFLSTGVFQIINHKQKCQYTVPEPC